MTYNGTRSPEEIEREIELERSQLSRTIDDLQDRLSLDGLLGGVGESLRDNSGEIGRAVARVVQRNPAAVALTGIGLAWLAYSASRPSSGHDHDHDEHHRAPRFERDPAAGYGDSTGNLDYHAARPAPATLRDPRLPQDTHADTDRHGGATQGSTPGASAGGEQDASPWDRISERAQETGAAARGHMEAAGEGVRGGWEKAKTAGRDRTARMAASARDLRARIYDGTQSMTEQARQRVVAARTKAYEAQVKAEYMARQGKHKAAGFYDDQPLVSGAMAFAVGAAIGGLLPRTSREDEAFGAYRDQLFDEAARVYEEERAKLKVVAERTAEEAKSQARSLADDIKHDAKATLEQAKDKVQHAADEVAAKAKREADKQGVGEAAKAEAEKAKAAAKGGSHGASAQGGSSSHGAAGTQGGSRKS